MRQYLQGKITLRRQVLQFFAATLLALPLSAKAAEPLKEIRIDWATYNPVSLVLKDQKLLEKEFRYSVGAVGRIQQSFGIFERGLA